MANPLNPKPGFDWTRVHWTGPYALVEWETCSYCGGAIGEESVPLRLWNEQSWAAVFCEACMATWWGMEPCPDEDEDAYDPFDGSEADLAERAIGVDDEPPDADPETS